MRRSVQSVKDKVVAHVEAEAEQWLGCAMTYTLFQSIQEHFADLTANQPTSLSALNSQTDKLTLGDDVQQVIKCEKKFRFLQTCLSIPRKNRQ